jgi:hypothetical protein
VTVTQDGPTAEERLTSGFGRLVSRRRLFRNALRGGLVVGGALASPLVLFEGRAYATQCTQVGHISTWGCNCASTPTCSASRCTTAGGCSSPARRRCDYWGAAEPGGNYCWCSLTCNRGGGFVGYYVCCDCWTGGSGGCSAAGGSSRCICKHFHCLQGC